VNQSQTFGTTILSSI